MNIKVRKSKSQGVVVLPASKSDMHRAIFAACLAKNESIIENITLSEDVNATIDIFRKLGAIIAQKDDRLFIKGINDFDSILSKDLNCNESGSTLRFIIPLLGLFDFEFNISGKPYLFTLS